MESLIKLFNKYKEIIMYLIMGGATTVVNWVTYSVMITICHPGQSLSGLLKMSANTIDVFIANIVAWTVAVIFAYITNKIWVFRSYSWKFKFVMKELGLFFISQNLNRFNRNFRRSISCGPWI